MKYTKLKRSTKDVMITSPKGSGKSILLNFIGYLKWRYQEVKVYANFKTLYPSINITSISDLDKILGEDKSIEKVFLGDDFEKMCFSRKSSSEENMVILNDILLDWGKCNCSGYFVGKRQLALDIGIREEVQEFWETEIRQKIMFRSGIREEEEKNNNLLKKHLDFLKVHVYRFDNNLVPLPEFDIEDLVFYGSLFDTQEIIRNVYKGYNKGKYKSKKIGIKDII